MNGFLAITGAIVSGLGGMVIVYSRSPDPGKEFQKHFGAALTGIGLIVTGTALYQQQARQSAQLERVEQTLATAKRLGEPLTAATYDFSFSFDARAPVFADLYPKLRSAVATTDAISRGLKLNDSPAGAFSELAFPATPFAFGAPVTRIIVPPNSPIYPTGESDAQVAKLLLGTSLRIDVFKEHQSEVEFASYQSKESSDFHALIAPAMFYEASQRARRPELVYDSSTERLTVRHVRQLAAPSRSYAGNVVALADLPGTQIIVGSTPAFPPNAPAFSAAQDARAAMAITTLCIRFPNGRSTDILAMATRPVAVGQRHPPLLVAAPASDKQLPICKRGF